MDLSSKCKAHTLHTVSRWTLNFDEFCHAVSPHSWTWAHHPGDLKSVYYCSLVYCRLRHDTGMGWTLLYLGNTIPVPMVLQVLQVLIAGCWITWLCWSTSTIINNNINNNDNNDNSNNQPLLDDHHHPSLTPNVSRGVYYSFYSRWWQQWQLQKWAGGFCFYSRWQWQWWYLGNNNNNKPSPHFKSERGGSASIIGNDNDDNIWATMMTITTPLTSNTSGGVLLLF